MTEYEHVTVERTGSKTVVTMDDVETRNSLSQGMIDDLTAAMERAERDESAAVVLTGTDGIFCAGGDISSFKRDATAALGGRIFGDSDFRAPFEAIEKLEKPVIAAVDGTAFAGGFELALVSDLVVVGEDVQVGTPETKIGIAPGVSYVRLKEHLSHHRAMEVMMLGEPMSGADAVEIGLFNEAVPRDAVTDVVDDYVEGLADVAPTALTVIKLIANRHRGGEDKVVSDLGIGVLLETDDAAEGIEAFLDDRDPEFEGH